MVSLRSPREKLLMQLNPFILQITEAQRREATCPRSHSPLVVTGQRQSDSVHEQVSTGFQAGQLRATPSHFAPFGGEPAPLR